MTKNAAARPSRLRKARREAWRKRVRRGSEPLFQAFGASEAVALLRCGEFRMGIEREVVGRGEAVRLFHAFAACAGFHAHTENHRC